MQPSIEQPCTPYEKTAMPSQERKCEARHIDLASDTDYIISRACIGPVEWIEKNDKGTSK